MLSGHLYDSARGIMTGCVIALIVPMIKSEELDPMLSYIALGVGVIVTVVLSVIADRILRY